MFVSLPNRWIQVKKKLREARKIAQTFNIKKALYWEKQFDKARDI